MAPADPPPANRFELRRRRSRAALMVAAIELFQTKGVQATSLEEICSRADVAVRTFFNHFETREHLHEAIAHERAVQLSELLDRWSRSPDPFAGRLTDLFAAIGSYLAERPAYREFVGEMLHLRPARGNEAVRSGILGRAAGRFLADAAARGEVTLVHSPEVLADLMLGAITTAISNWSASSDYDLVRGLSDDSHALLDLFVPADTAPPQGG